MKDWMKEDFKGLFILKKKKQAVTRVEHIKKSQRHHPFKSNPDSRTIMQKKWLVCHRAALYQLLCK